MSRRNTAKHVHLTVSRVRRIVSGCAFETTGDISAEAVEEFMVQLRDEDDLGHRTYNHYLQVIEGFCNWLVKKRRLPANPVQGIPRLNNATDVRHPRRALTAEEFLLLLRSCRESQESIQCYDGEARSRIYLLSYMTGLRRGELASLTSRSFDLESNPPTITVHATVSKHRRKDVLPLHPKTVPLLTEWMAGLNADDPLFPGLAKHRTWLMVRKDLERVGIPYQTAEGIADFHAAGRHTHITELFRNGASVPEAQALARHSDVKMTMRYTHIGINDQARALEALTVPCQDIVRNPAVAACPGSAADVSDCPTGDFGRCDTSPSEKTLSGSHQHKRAPSVADGAQWRRRESNPRPVDP